MQKLPLQVVEKVLVQRFLISKEKDWKNQYCQLCELWGMCFGLERNKHGHKVFRLEEQRETNESKRNEQVFVIEKLITLSQAINKKHSLNK